MTSIMQWANANEGFISLMTFVLAAFLLPVVHFALRRVTSKMSNALSAEEVRQIESIRSEFYTKLKRDEDQLGYGPFLIRDINRDRLYFDGDTEEFQKNGAPPSFKVHLVDLSVHGICVYHGQPVRIKKIADEETWCLAEQDDADSFVAHPIGIIPFSSIVAINWHGDPATHFPHIFCRFDQARGWPYKRFEYCERTPCIRGLDLYRPLVDADQLIRKHF